MNSLATRVAVVYDLPMRKKQSVEAGLTEGGDAGTKGTGSAGSRRNIAAPKKKVAAKKSAAKKAPAKKSPPAKKVAKRKK